MWFDLGGFVFLKGSFDVALGSTVVDGVELAIYALGNSVKYCYYLYCYYVSPTLPSPFQRNSKTVRPQSFFMSL